MRAPAVSFANKLWAAALAALLTFTLVPASALAEGEGAAADTSAEEPQEVSASQSDASSGVAPTLASGLVGNPTTFINFDVVLDGEPVVGSFTVDGLTFAVIDDTAVGLVGVSPDRKRVTNSQESDGSPVAPMLASGTEGLEADNSALALPESVTYEGIDYAVVSIGAYAFYLSGVASVELPASIAQVDDRAFRSSDVASVEVANGNATYSSFDGALYDAAQLSLLLIPEGKQGTVLLPSTAESAAPSVFSHCPLVTQIAVEEGSAAFASENGLLYDASLATLLRVPAGATDITIRDGCTTIAAGALEACASLATITAPASVTSISPDVFTSVPTVSLPATTLAEDAPQISALVALTTFGDGLCDFVPEVIVRLPTGSDEAVWEHENGQAPFAVTRLAATSAAQQQYTACVYPNGHRLEVLVRWWHAGESRWGETIGQYYIGPHESESFFEDAHVTSWHLELENWGTSSSPLWVSVNYFDERNTVLSESPLAYASVVVRGAEEGYTLLGLNYDPNAGSALYSNGQHQYGDMSMYAIWSPNPYTIAFDSQGGSAATSIQATYDANATLPTPTRQGYTFRGWDTKVDGTGTRYQAGTVAKLNLTATANATVTLYAQWAPTISADVPLEVTARVDLLGIEEQEEAAGYIESRCGEPLTVADVAFEPLSGATELFGAASVADVALEVLAAGSASPDARFALDAFASQAPTSAAAFRMASYGTRVPISYRFAIPDELLPSLTEATKPVCAVAYTVVLA